MNTTGPNLCVDLILQSAWRELRLQVCPRWWSCPRFRHVLLCTECEKSLRQHCSWLCALMTQCSRHGTGLWRSSGQSQRLGRLRMELHIVWAHPCTLVDNGRGSRNSSNRSFTPDVEVHAILCCRTHPSLHMTPLFGFLQPLRLYPPHITSSLRMSSIMTYNEPLTQGGCLDRYDAAYRALKGVASPEARPHYDHTRHVLGGGG